MNAGKFIAIKRGAFDQEPEAIVVPIPPPPPARFPLIQRLNDATFQSLMIFRQHLPALAKGEGK